MIRNFRNLNPGDSISATEFNRLAAEVERLSQARVEPPLEMADLPGGRCLRWNGTLTAITSCLSWTMPGGTINNYSLPSTSTAITEYTIAAGSSATTLTGIVPQTLSAGPQFITIINAYTATLTISGNSASSTAANRIQLPPTYGSSVALAQNDSITLWYDTLAAQPQWQVAACTVDSDSSGAPTALINLGTLAGTNNNLGGISGADIIEVQVAGTATITGVNALGSSSVPVLLTFVNAGTGIITFLGNNAGSLAANRIAMPIRYGNTITLNPGDTLSIWYDADASQPAWYVQACSAQPFSGALYTGSDSHTITTGVGGGASFITSGLTKIYDTNSYASGTVTLVVPEPGYYGGYFLVELSNQSGVAQVIDLGLAPNSLTGISNFYVTMPTSANPGMYSIPWECFLSSGNLNLTLSAGIFTGGTPATVSLVAAGIHRIS